MTKEKSENKKEREDLAETLREMFIGENNEFGEEEKKVGELGEEKLNELNIDFHSSEEESEDELLKKVEAALFISARFMSVPELTMLTGINPLMMNELLEQLKEKYEKNVESAFTVIKMGELWKMDVKEEYHKIVTKLAAGSAEFSRAEQETLAIIAYKQPIKQSTVVQIRGNKAYDHVKNFISVGLIKAKKFSHTQLLTLSEEFYNYFQLKRGEEKEG